MAISKKTAISFYEASQDMNTFQRLSDHVVKDVLTDYGLQDMFKDVRVQLNHVEDYAAMDLMVSILPQQLGVRHRYSYPYITSANFSNSVEDAIRRSLHNALIKNIEESPYFKRKNLTTDRKDERIKALEEEVKILQETIQAQLNSAIEFNRGDSHNVTIGYREEAGKESKYGGESEFSARIRRELKGE